MANWSEPRRGSGIPPMPTKGERFIDALLVVMLVVVIVSLISYAVLVRH